MHVSASKCSTPNCPFAHDALCDHEEEVADKNPFGYCTCGKVLEEGTDGWCSQECYHEYYDNAIKNEEEREFMLADKKMGDSKP